MHTHTHTYTYTHTHTCARAGGIERETDGKVSQVEYDGTCAFSRHPRCISRRVFLPTWTPSSVAPSSPSPPDDGNSEGNGADEASRARAAGSLLDVAPILALPCQCELMVRLLVNGLAFPGAGLRCSCHGDACTLSLMPVGYKHNMRPAVHQRRETPGRFLALALATPAIVMLLQMHRANDQEDACSNRGVSDGSCCLAPPWGRSACACVSVGVCVSVSACVRGVGWPFRGERHIKQALEQIEERYMY